jgi:beta-glucosidase
MVLLKNQGGALPLRKDLRTIAVIGPNADDAEVLLGNYNGTPADPVTPLRGIREAVSPRTRVLYARGTNIADGVMGKDSTASDVLEAQAEQVARRADAVVLVLGLTNHLEGEEMRVQVDGFHGGDRTALGLPASQERLLERIVATGKPVTLVLINGSALAINWAQEHVPAIVEAWYPGQAGGSALADVLFGDYNPAGRLPVTFYRSVDDLPAFDDYSMTGRTYRFFDGPPLYPFGHGLSYTTFSYDSLRTSSGTIVADGSITIRANVTNTGRRAGDEVVQLYVQHLASAVTRPRQELRGFRRISLKPGETRTVDFTLPATALAYWNSAIHGWTFEGKPVRLEVGASSGDIRLTRVVQ